MPQGSPPPFAQNRSNMAIFKVEGGRRLRGEITPQGAKKRGASDPLRHAAHAGKGNRTQRPADPGRDTTHRVAAGDGRRSGAPVRRELFVPSRRHRPGLPALGRLLPPGQPPQGVGDAAGSDAGAFRRGLHAQPGGDRSAAAGSTPTSSAFRSWAPRSISTLRPPAPKSAARNSRDATCCSTRLR